MQGRLVPCTPDQDGFGLGHLFMLVVSKPCVKRHNMFAIEVGGVMGWREIGINGRSPGCEVGGRGRGEWGMVRKTSPRFAIEHNR